MTNVRATRTAIALCAVLLVAAPLAAQPPTDETATPQPLVDAYDSLADTILAAKQTEWNLVHSILATTYRHAEAVQAQAKRKLAAGGNTTGEIERLAALVAQLGTEGDAAVAAIRKRLVEGGHHHHAKAEKEGLYDEGFVIVTRASKKVFLDSARRIGKLGAAPDAAALDAEWAKVEREFLKLHEDATR